MPRQTNWTATDMGLGSYDNMQVSFRNYWFKASITLRIDRGNTFIIIYVYFIIFIQDIYIYIFIGS